MMRAAAKNHAYVGVVVDPAEYAPVLDELRARRRAVGDDTRRALARDAFAHTAAYDAAIVHLARRGDGRATLPPSTSHLALERTDEALRYGENPHQQGARYRASAATSWWDGVVQHGGMALSLPQPLRHRRGLAARPRPRRPARPCAIIKHANPCGVARRRRPRRPRTQRASSATSVGVRRHRRRQPPGRRRDGRGAWSPVRSRRRRSRRATSRARSRRCAASARTLRLLEAPPPGPTGSTSARSPAASSSRTPDHFAADRDRLAGRHQGRAHRRAVARPRAGVADLRPREVERDRAGQGRPGRRHRRAASRTASTPARSRRRRPPAGPRAARAASDAFFPFPDGVDAAPPPASPRSSSRAARCATRRSSPRPTSSASRWCSPANGTSCTDGGA